ncbi:MAG: hypothetical protein QG556_786 [Pseudomonadota bacterium]|nr:hypothetical protein [Pseudomonadota bacterium]
MNVSKLVIAVFSSALAFSAFAVAKSDSTVDKNDLIAKHHHHHKHKSEHKRDVAKHKISDMKNKH